MNLARTLTWPILAAVLLAAGPAGAQIKLLLPEPDSPFLKPGQRAELHGLLKAKAGDYPDLELVEAPGLEDLRAQAGCKGSAPKCLAAAGRVVGAEQILFVQIQRLPGRQMMIFQLVDAASSRRLKQIRQRARNGMLALHRATGQGWVKMFGLRVDCRVQVSANVEDAEVSLDGLAAGSAPVTIRRKLRTGRHTVRVRHPDYLLGEKKFRARARSCRANLRFNLKLKPKGDDIPPVALVGPPVTPPGPGGKLKDDGPGEKLKDDGPGEKLKDDGPGTKLKDDEPGGKLKDDGPIAKSKDDGPKDDGPGGKLKDDGPEDTSIAGPLLRRKPVADKLVVEKPFLPKDEKPEPEPGDQTPIYKEWWFWTAVGAVAVAGVATGLGIGLSGGGDSIPSGKGRLTLEF